jgi:hypothetical protein
VDVQRVAGTLTCSALDKVTELTWSESGGKWFAEGSIVEGVRTQEHAHPAQSASRKVGITQTIGDKNPLCAGLFPFVLRAALLETP